MCVDVILDHLLRLLDVDEVVCQIRKLAVADTVKRCQQHFLVLIAVGRLILRRNRIRIRLGLRLHFLRGFNGRVNDRFFHELVDAGDAHFVKQRVVEFSGCDILIADREYDVLAAD